jgi:hypothetical protein
VLAFVGDNDLGTDAVFLRDADGGLARFADVSGSTAVAWAPSGDRLAWAVADAPGQPYKKLHIATANGQTRLEPVSEPLLAFFWSPDGSQFAYLAPGEATDTLHWKVVPAGGGAARTIATFQPTAEFLQVATYFDQYVQSLRLWSADGRSLLYAGWPAGDGRDRPPAIMVVPIDGSAPSQAIAEGVIGSFAPPPPASATPTPGRK